MSPDDAILPEQVTEAALRGVGIEDVARARRLLRDLAGQGVTDDDLAPLIPLLLNALRLSPDPERALNSFSRWFAAVSSPYSHLQTLRRHPAALDLFCLITGSSQYFADLLARHPEYFDILANPGARGGHKSATTLYRELSALVDACRLPGLKRDVLRRWKAREMLRIGARDLAGLAEMPVTAREFSNLADACVQKALDIAFAMHPLQGGGLEPEAERPSRRLTSARTPIPQRLPLAVIGMGKLGGRELNYSSDIDLMFVHGDALPPEVTLETGRRLETTAYLIRVAETVVKVLSEESANGHVFRVDMRLRPEGRFGPLSRSLAGYRAYYESWAETWERQALLKARFLAGDRALGEQFMAMIAPFVYRRVISSAFLDDIRANKRRIEKKCELEGQTERNIKTGYGGIRDVEFIVQKMQLEFGGERPRLRAPNTLVAIQHLRHERFLTDGEADELAADYIFLRTLEHRLQLLHGFQTQLLPPASDTSEWQRIARRMGFPTTEWFAFELRQRRDRVHAYLERLFYNAAEPLREKTEAAEVGAGLDDLLDNIAEPVAQEQLTERLRQAGFHDLPAALRALQLPMEGNEFGGMPPDTPVVFKRVASRLLELLARSPDPDAGLAGVEALALAVPNRAQLYATFEESPETLRKLTSLAAASPSLFKRLTRHLEWMEGLLEAEEQTFDPQIGEADEAANPYLNAYAARVATAKSKTDQLDAVARVYLRETLAIGAREVWGEVDVVQTMGALTRLAEATLETLMVFCAEPLIAAHPQPEFARRALSRVAVVGLGKLGGEELGYGSDWDVVFVYDEERLRGEAARSAERFDLVNTLVQQVLAAGRDLAPRGAMVEIDLRLRPWGRKGALIQTIQGFATYYRTAAETWERQAALKARFLAGNPQVGRRFERLLRAVSAGRGISPEEDEAIRAMKRRIESERLKPEEQETDLKLGHGGLTDIEWLTQRLQLRWGARHAVARVPNTLRALTALATIRALENAEVDALAATYQLLTRVRNALWLQTGIAQDVFPAEPLRRERLGRMLGYGGGEQEAGSALWEEIRAGMREARAIFERRFLRD